MYPTRNQRDEQINNLGITGRERERQNQWVIAANWAKLDYRRISWRRQGFTFRDVWEVRGRRPVCWILWLMDERRDNWIVLCVWERIRDASWESGRDEYDGVKQVTKRGKTRHWRNKMQTRVYNELLWIWRTGNWPKEGPTDKWRDKTNLTQDDARNVFVALCYVQFCSVKVNINT